MFSIRRVQAAVCLVSVVFISPRVAAGDMHEAKQLCAKAFLGQPYEKIRLLVRRTSDGDYLVWMNLALTYKFLKKKASEQAALKELKRWIETNPSAYRQNPRPLHMALTYDAVTKTKDFSSALWPGCLAQVQGEYHHADNQVEDMLDTVSIALERGDKPAALALLNAAPPVLEKASPNQISHQGIASWIGVLYEKAGEHEQAAKWLKKSPNPAQSRQTGQAYIERHASLAADALGRKPDEDIVAAASAIAQDKMDEAQTRIRKAVEQALAMEPHDYADENDWALRAHVFDLLENTPINQLPKAIPLAVTIVPEIKSPDVKAETQSYLDIKRSNPARGTYFVQLIELQSSLVEMYR